MRKKEPKKGFYRPLNPKKYKGDPTNIIHRSGLEKKFMEFLDTSSSILEWSSEEFYIPYWDPTSGRYRRYFPDFYFRAKTPQGTDKHVVVELKPKSQTIEPKIPKRKTQRFITEVMTWGVNCAKWEAAKEYCSLS